MQAVCKICWVYVRYVSNVDTCSYTIIASKRHGYKAVAINFPFTLWHMISFSAKIVAVS